MNALFLPALLFVQHFVALPAHAIVTHTGIIDFKVVHINEKGKGTELATREGKVEMDWDKETCSVTTKDSVYLCKFDITTDIVSPETGEVWMQGAPLLHFDQKTIDRLMIDLVAVSEKGLAATIWKAIRQTAPSRERGFEVPWYRIKDNQNIKEGGVPEFDNAFSGLQVELNLMSEIIGRDQTIQYQMYFHSLKPKKGAFDVINTNRSGSF